MQQKVVIITGGSSGIGRALAFEFGRNGSRVVITGRQEAPLRQTSDELRAAGIENHYVVADVRQETDNQRTVEETIRVFGRIDVLVNNAGITMRGLCADTRAEVFRTVMDINFFGTLYATQAALPYLKESRGSIVGISSIAGYRGLPVRSGYSASKFAMNGFLEALRTELLPDGVHVLTACPGFTASNIRFSSLDKDGNATGDSMRDESGMMSAEEAARQIYRATVRRKRELILTAQGKLTVFVNKWLAGWADKQVYQTLAKEKGSPLPPLKG
jgi:dehydrogenase/reductase SDR family protein 7B